ncbi:Kinesin-like protein 2 [Candida viswanathii]|uniref:Kinesin-like protein n=1 Tax=Candida viswanathii TaxID=5486 RepID=A0A367XM10_9ASCO|nr:Kinesin-like protein 2 [Candida viswanathii]
MEHFDDINTRLKERLVANVTNLKRPLDDNTNTVKMRKYQGSRLPMSSTSSDVSEASRFRQLIADKKAELGNLKLSSMSVRNEIETQNLENFRIQASFNDLERTLHDVELKTGELTGYRDQSLESLQKKYELKTRELGVRHQERLNNIKEDITRLVDELLTEKQYKYEKQILDLKNEISGMVDEKESVESELNKTLILLKETQHREELEAVGELEEQCEKARLEMEGIDKAIDAKRREIEDIKLTRLPQLAKECSRFTALLDQLRAKNKDKQTEIDGLERQITSKKSKMTSLSTGSKERANELHRLTFEIARMRSELVDQESKRRKLHGQLQDLKGNIRVFCRVRSTPSQDLIQYKVPQDINDDSKQDLLITKTSYSNSNSTYRFLFDKIFQPDQPNEAIFEELSQLIQCSLDGTNVCVFAYGQTGSGKTFTMSHPANGMIPMSLMKIFNDIEDLKEKGWYYSIQGRFIEIYNESIIDLLNPATSDKHEIKHDDSMCRTSVTNVTTIDITTPEQANEILGMANKKRSTAATKSNDHSSRSHSIFIIDIQGSNHLTSESCCGTLNLIDLAGSERLNNSRAEGDRLKETQAINKSLSCLGDVIYSLNLKDGSHIPYRNSKLTYLLKHSLGGNSKTLMFVNISPLNKDLNETINSLRFATKVNNTKINK